MAGKKGCARSAQSLRAEAEFRSALSEYGATLIEPNWLGCKIGHRAQCRNGHVWIPAPDAFVHQGVHRCDQCPGYRQFKSPPPRMARAERAFREALAAGGITLVEPRYLGNRKHHDCICAAGHPYSPIPMNVRRGHGCPVCANNDSASARRSFETRMAELGATVDIPVWRGVGHRYDAMCAAGHACRVLPESVQQGQGICSECAQFGFRSHRPAVVYVLTHPTLGAHKVGVTNVGTTRLNLWRRRGWTVYQTRYFDTGAETYAVEQAVLRWLRHDLGHGPYLSETDAADGWSETVCADSIDLPTIWARVVTEAAALAC